MNAKNFFDLSESLRKKDLELRANNEDFNNRADAGIWEKGMNMFSDFWNSTLVATGVSLMPTGIPFAGEAVNDVANPFLMSSIILSLAWSLGHYVGYRYVDAPRS